MRYDHSIEYDFCAEIEKEHIDDDEYLLACYEGNIEKVRLFLDQNILDGRHQYISTLMVACQFGHIDMAKLLLEKGADINRTCSGGTPLCFAALSGSLDLVKLLLEQPNLDKDQENMILPNALFFACKSGNLDILKLLLENGIGRLDQLDDEDVSLLMLASFFGHQEIVDFLLSAGVDVNLVDTCEYSALMYASVRGHYSIAKLLLEKSKITDTDKENLLLFACESGNLDIVRLFEDADFSTRSSDDYSTALMYAARGDNPDIIQLVLEKIPETINHVDDRKKTALMYACKESKINSVRTLLQHKNIDVNVHAGNSYIDDSAFKFACGNEHSSEIANLLLDHPNFDINKCGGFNKSPLMYACKFGKYDVVKRLLSDPKIKSINKTDQDGYTAFMYACRSGNVEIVKHFLGNYDINLNKVSKSGGTALSNACEWLRVDVVKLLLEQKKIDIKDNCLTSVCREDSDNAKSLEIAKLLLAKDPTLITKDCISQLMFACESDNVELVRLLLSFDGIDVNLTEGDFDDVNALVCACGYGSIDIVRMLLERPEIDLDPKSVCNEQAFESSKNIEILKLMMDTFGYNINTVFEVPLLNNACEMRNIEMVKWLLSFDDIDVNSRGTFSRTPLMEACDSRHDMEMVKLLLARDDIDVNLQDRDGDTALMYACWTSSNIVNLLLKNKNIDVNIKNNEGKTALMVAADRGGANIVKSLLQMKDIDISIEDNRGDNAIDYAGSDEGLKKLLRREIEVLVDPV